MPNGYHVPSTQEWQGLYSTWLKIYTTGANNSELLKNTLLLPKVGLRNRSSAGISTRNTHGYYWSSTPNGSYSYYMRLEPSYIYSAFNGNQSRSYGFSVRCFKD